MAAPVPLSIRRRQMTNKLNYLSENDIFSDLTPEEIDGIARIATAITCSANQIIYTPDPTREVLFLLKRGKVQLYRISSEGDKLVIKTLSAGTVFGEMPLLAQSMRGAFAETLEESLLWSMSRSDLERMFANIPKVALRVIELLAQRMMEADARLGDIAYRRIPARLASLLLRLNQKVGLESEIVGYTHQNLADMIGTYRETTTQTLGTFEEQNLVKIGRKRIKLLDIERLRQIAED
jgi:CRP/FNR family transcriptional regulator, cyclic AMP receptor protein